MDCGGGGRDEGSILSGAKGPFWSVGKEFVGYGDLTAWCRYLRNHPTHPPRLYLIRSDCFNIDKVKLKF